MTIAQLIAAKRSQLAPALAERAVHRTRIDEIRSLLDTESREPSPAESQTVLDAQTAIRGIDERTAAVQAEIDQLEAEQRADQAADELAQRASRAAGPALPAYDGVARVGAEERTYSSAKSARGEASFFVDAYASQQGNDQARQRLNRNLQEAIVEHEVSERATSTSSFGGLVVPQYLVGLATQVIRSGRPTANACTGLPLPAQGMSLDIPRGTTGAAVASQATENTALQNTDEVTTDLVVPVRTIGGQQDVSRQSLERGTPGIDELVYLDLAGAYHAELDRQVVAGSGASGQMLGILNTSAIQSATAFGAAPTFANYNSKLAGLIAAIAAVGKGITPGLIVANPRRWGWLTSLVDGQGRPLFPVSAAGVMNAGGVNMNPAAYGADGESDRSVTIVGQMQGVPITTDSNIPTNIGTNAEDQTVVFDPRHALLWEDGDGQPKQLRFEQTLGQQLTVKLVIYGYAAFTAGRYPTAFGKIGGLDTTAGQGLVAPTF